MDDGLQRFFEEEVRDRDYADLLLREAASPPSSASGNAYNVVFTADEVSIAHHYLDEPPPMRLSRRAFTAALSDWRRRLAV
jgi:hypothetical protein